MSKRFSKTPEKYGTGHPEGLIESTSSNNAGLSSAWIPALVFGIPGDAVTAIAVGVLFMKGVNPGPRLFVENPSMPTAIILCFFVANLLPALVGVRFGNFLWTTALGIVPGAIVFTWIGVGVGEVFARGETPDLSLMREPYVLGPILGLCLLAALPIAIKTLRGGREV